MLKLSDYAKRENITSEAARLRIATTKKNEEGFASHVLKQGRATYLDDEALAILDRRYPQPLVISDTSHELEVAALRDENDKLKSDLIAAQQEIIGLQRVVLEAQELAKALPLAQDEAKQLREQLDAERARADEAEARANAPIWSRLFKRRGNV